MLFQISIQKYWFKIVPEIGKGGYFKSVFKNTDLKLYQK